MTPTLLPLPLLLFVVADEENSSLLECIRDPAGQDVAAVERYWKAADETTADPCS
jgi:hypothetical protein